MMLAPIPLAVSRERQLNRAAPPTAGSLIACASPGSVGGVGGVGGAFQGWAVCIASARRAAGARGVEILRAAKRRCTLSDAVSSTKNTAKLRVNGVKAFSPLVVSQSAQGLALSGRGNVPP